MSTPDPTPTDLEPASRAPEWLPVAQPRPTPPTRTTRACWWLGGHFGELAAVAGTATLAVTASPWWAVGSGTVAIVWAVHEYRTHHGQTGSDEK